MLHSWLDMRLQTYIKMANPRYKPPPGGMSEHRWGYQGLKSIFTTDAVDLPQDNARELRLHHAECPENNGHHAVPMPGIYPVPEGAIMHGQPGRSRRQHYVRRRQQSRPCTEGGRHRLQLCDHPLSPGWILYHGERHFRLLSSELAYCHRGSYG